MGQGSTKVSVRATILALARLGIAPEAEVKSLEQRWTQYRQASCMGSGPPRSAA